MARSASALGGLLLRQGGGASGIGSGPFLLRLSGGLLRLGGRHLCVALGLFGGQTVGFSSVRGVPVQTRLFGGLLGLGLRGGFTRRGGGALIGQFLGLDLLVGDDARVFRHLGGFTRIGLRFLPIPAAIQEVLGVLQVDHGLLKGLRGISLGAGQARDFHGVFGFGELQRALRIDLHGLISLAIEHVLTAFQQVVVRIHLLDGSAGVVADEILRDYHVARLRHGEVRLRGHDQAERLQIGSGEQLGMVAFENDFAQIDSATFRRDAPHHVAHVFRTVLRGGRHMVQGSFRFWWSPSGWLPSPRLSRRALAPCRENQYGWNRCDGGS